MGSHADDIRADVLHHPVRWRIAQTLIGRELTTAQVSEQLDDISHATLYRQVAILIDAGLVEVVSERPNRGGVERTLRLATPGTDDRGGTVTDEQVRTYFTVFIAGLSGDLDRYLSQPQIDPVADHVSFRQAALWLSDTERAEFAAALEKFFAPFLDRPAAPGRRRHVLSTVFLPDT
ncbi:helix-turn-helix domain-containing protein [Gordonia soli]|uniref:Putative ArsR family transcriptional regulator n=1 Tax=Gordonia soli NBRC 108243 TaxID=1223545 RepID=M0QLJ9_9ACTN|nr:helix-turn-helix domain-containing protein [Gordonia soli]GAC68277.1 putative ArsR family transcriptional regulator [Gordonia soli NBRC 108243]